MAKLRAISHPRAQPKVPYTAYLPHYYTIYNIHLSTFDGILVIVRSWVTMVSPELLPIAIEDGLLACFLWLKE